jgi:hypothetical protein
MVRRGANFNFAIWGRRDCMTKSDCTTKAIA